MNKAIIFGSERGKDVALFNGQSDDCGHANVDFDCPSGFFEWYVTANDYYDGNVEKSEFSRQEIISAKGVSFLPSNHNYYATNVIYRKKNPMPMHISVKTLIFTMWKSKRSGLR